MAAVGPSWVCAGSGAGAGSSGGDPLEDALLLFQLDYGLEPTAELDDDTTALLLRAHDQDLRPWKERDWELPDEPHPDAPKPKQEVS